MKGLHSNGDLYEEASGNGEEDRLIELPDDVLLNILDRVCTLDAVRTCLLSKRTLHLPAMLSRIAIDVYSLLPAAMEDDDLSIAKTTLARTNGWVSHATRKILGAKPPNMPIRSLKLRFFLRRDECFSIGTSVAGAMAAHKVDAAEFKIDTEKDLTDCRDTDLRLYAKRFNTFLRVCPEAFTGLTRLHLENLRLREPDIANILATCGRMESLHLFECDAGVGSVMRVEHGRLVELEIFYGKFRTVELRSLPKLRRMVYHNWAFADEPLFLGFVPQLFKLSLANAYLSKNKIRLSQLLLNATSISDLHLDFQSEMVWVWPECPGLLGPVLRELRRVNLDFLPKGCDIAWTLFLLEGAPSLEEMCLSVQDHWCGSAETRRAHRKKRGVQWEPSLAAADFKHENLARLTIYGFQSTHSFIRYVKHVLSVSANIQEISLHDTKVCDFCTEEFGLKMDDCLSKYPRTSTKKDFLRERISEGLATTRDVIHFRS